MKKSVLSKLIAIVLSVLLMATSFAAFAEAIDGGANPGAISTDDTTLTIPKGITLKNDESGTYYNPNITYTYTIAPVTPATGAKVSGVDVVEGPTGGATLASNSVAFTAGEVSGITSSGKEITQNLTVNIDLTKFSQVGIYRYKISDTTATSALFTAGITRKDNYNKDRYLDVYIKNGTSGVAVAGYALTQTNSATAGDKDGGYTKEYETTTDAGTGTVTENTDVYRTYNVKLEKQVTGDMGDKNHAFPFAVTVNNNSLTYYSNGSAATGTSISTTLADGDTLEIKGLNPHATVGYVETNDTGSTYKVTINGKTSTLVNEAEVASGSTATLAVGAVSAYDTDNSNTSVAVDSAATDYSQVKFINNLASISPTGVVLRYAPFILLLACAGALVLFATRTKARRKETEAI